VVGEAAIMQQLKLIPAGHDAYADGEMALATALERAGVSVFAEIVTTRETFRHGTNLRTFEMVLDSTDFGHCVGEVRCPAWTGAHAAQRVCRGETELRHEYPAVRRWS
jgi:hypothetical protein